MLAFFSTQRGHSGDSICTVWHVETVAGYPHRRRLLYSQQLCIVCGHLYFFGGLAFNPAFASDSLRAASPAPPIWYATTLPSRSITTYVGIELT